MSKFRKIILAVLISCFAVCAGLAVAACTDKSAANFRMPAGYNPDADFNGVYNISVKSSGGMSLNGVKVDVRKGGSKVVSGISKDGYINLTLQPDVYQLVVDSKSLPEGYYLDDEQYYTKADEGDVEIRIPSRVITTTGGSGTSYSVGDVMYDFAFNNAVSGVKYTLSELLDENTGYKAVMLNFFYVDCSPCRLEFPAIQEAYASYSDRMAVVALSYQDSAADIKAFAEQRGLKFHMGYDSSGLTSKFGVNAFPTTVIVDRFGVAAFKTDGGEFEPSYWRGLFQHYTSDDYVQIDPETPEPGEPTEYTKPNAGLVMPESDDIADALNGEVKGGASINKYYAEEGRDKDYSWPWLIKTESGKSYLDASNANKDYSFATLYAELRLTAGDAISYDYSVKTEAEHDILYVLVNGAIVAQHSGNSEGWKESLAVYVASRYETVTLAFMYFKDLGKNVDNERASIRNLNIRPVSEVADTIDQKTAIINGLTYDTGYNDELTGNYNVSIVKNKDGYYYHNGAIVLADILNAGYWAEQHLGSTTFVNPEGTNQANSVYHLSYWKMSNYDRADKQTPLLFSYLSPEQSENFIEDYYLQGFSDNGLLPVTDNLIEILKAFVDAMYKNNADMFVDGDEKYDGQWLEFCYYYEHYGDRHTPLPEGADGDIPDYDCYKILDPIQGLVYYNAYTAYEGTAEQPVANKVNVTKIINLSDGGGVKYKFVPEHTGVYLFYSKAPSGKGTDPKVIVLDENLNRLLEADNDMRYDSYIYRDSHDDYYAYVWLEAKKTYYVHGAMSVAGDTGSYDMFIEYQGKDTVNYLTFASVGDGVFTFTEKPPYYNYYVAVSVAYSSADDCYYHYTDYYQFGSKMYIDFVHNNYFDRNGHSLYEMIENGIFDFRKNGGRNYTTDMRTYYHKSISGKNKGDELYGLIEANEQLVNILSYACQIYYEEGASSGAWEMFACYYEYIGNPNPANG